ncbi:hypothetical protein TNCT_331941 [Trichonephila clavata]|uniref:C2H2-type domain-containing protein n=1 Tax=Trichonephila clavata TaxID=2740835 RepID=A0A8X6G1G8_TRICU|nr:hypothetical protein TNCT_331941 [Trichonephila clavata]
MSAERTGEDLKHVCDMCRRTFQFKRHYMKHLLVHKERTLHQCPICVAGFISEFELRDHLSIHAEESRKKCKYCSTAFGSPCMRKDHENKHKKENCLICTICHGMFQTKLLLQQHLLLHTAKRPFNSDGCAGGFTQSEGMGTTTYQQDRKKEFICHLCGKNFRNNSDLQRHQVSFDIIEETKRAVKANFMQFVTGRPGGSHLNQPNETIEKNTSAASSLSATITE